MDCGRFLGRGLLGGRFTRGGKGESEEIKEKGCDERVFLRYLVKGRIMYCLMNI